MCVYIINPVTDNPLFEGLALEDREDLLDTEPPDWIRNYQTWQPRSLKGTWPSLEVVGNVRRFNDYPCINLSRPAFSQRAVDLLRDVLEPNGELLPVRHRIGTYYFYNCTRTVNAVDLTKSDVVRLDGGIITRINGLVFIDERLDGLTVFRERTQLRELFCTQTFVDRVEGAGLQGFAFVPIWPLPEGVTYNHESYRIAQLCRKWEPKESPALDVKANTVVLRLYCERKKASNQEVAAAEAVMANLEKVLYDEEQKDTESYFGNVEGHDVVDHEIRIFLSAPDCDRLVSRLMPTLRSLPWSGTFHVVKRRGEFMDDNAKEEYVPVV
jgi:hypothetical protein